MVRGDKKKLLATAITIRKYEILRCAQDDNMEFRRGLKLFKNGNIDLSYANPMTFIPGMAFIYQGHEGAS